MQLSVFIAIGWSNLNLNLENKKSIVFYGCHCPNSSYMQILRTM